MTEKEDTEVTKGQKIAAILFIVNSIMNFLVVVHDSGHEDNGMTIAPSVIDMLIAVSILRGSTKWVSFAIVRVVIGMLLFSGMSFAKQDFVSFGMQIILSTTYLLLLIGRPQKVRLGFAYPLIGLMGIFYFFNIQYMLFGTNYLNQFALQMMYKMEEVNPKGITSAQFQYKIGPVNSGWKQRDRVEFKKENPLADNWLVHPEYDAHVMIIAEELDSSLTIQHNLFLENVKNNYKRVGKAKIISEQTVNKNGFNFTNLEVEAMVEGIPLYYKFGVYTKKNIGIQVVGFCTKDAHLKTKNEIADVLDSFQFLQEAI